MIRIGIMGYGNLGREVEANVKASQDMTLVGIFSRRPASELMVDSPVYTVDQLADFTDKVDVLILCGGSYADIPEQGPRWVQRFHTVDSYDNHSNIPTYYEHMDDEAKKAGKLAVIATGWDPGLFSLNRLIAQSILPEGDSYTFWGKGVSQGHGDAVRRVAGVKDAVQYTLPNDSLIQRIQQGEMVEYHSKQAHTREVFVVLEDGADEQLVHQAIVEMPDYFQGYQTEVNFIDQETLESDHSGLPHGGRVMRSGTTASGDRQLMEFSLQLNSNPAFTAAVNVAYARAAYRLAQEGNTGAMTVFDIAPKYLSPLADEVLRQELL